MKDSVGNNNAVVDGQNNVDVVEIPIRHDLANSRAYDERYVIKLNPPKRRVGITTGIVTRPFGRFLTAKNTNE